MCCDLSLPNLHAVRFRLDGYKYLVRDILGHTPLIPHLSDIVSLKKGHASFTRSYKTRSTRDRSVTRSLQR